jgi:hypothetical protein
MACVSAWLVPGAEVAAGAFAVASAGGVAAVRECS